MLVGNLEEVELRLGQPESNVIKLFTLVILNVRNKKFVPSNPFQSSLMFVGKARSLP